MKIKVYKKFNGKWMLSRIVYPNDFEIERNLYPNGFSINEVVIRHGEHCEFIEFSKMRKWFDTITVWEKGK